jgi:hypothetical protein
MSTAAEQLHRPADNVSLAREARALASLGLTDRDIAAALDLHVDQVRPWIAMLSEPVA